MHLQAPLSIQEAIPETVRSIQAKGAIDVENEDQE
jgi:hypothetical protein